MTCKEKFIDYRMWYISSEIWHITLNKNHFNVVLNILGLIVFVIWQHKTFTKVVHLKIRHVLTHTELSLFSCWFFLGWNRCNPTLLIKTCLYTLNRPLQENWFSRLSALFPSFLYTQKNFSSKGWGCSLFYFLRVRKAVHYLYVT